MNFSFTFISRVLFISFLFVFEVSGQNTDQGSQFTSDQDNCIDACCAKFGFSDSESTSRIQSRAAAVNHTRRNGIQISSGGIQLLINI